MENPLILHLFTPAAQASPFDVNMAYDAGYDAVVPYTGVTLADVAGLTQDAIFSRGPKRRAAHRRSASAAAISTWRSTCSTRRATAMVPPFAVSVFADPSGAFTTAAAVVAAVEKHLRAKHDTALAGKRVLVLGGTGPVGTAAATLAAQEGRDRRARQPLGARPGASRVRSDPDALRARACRPVRIDAGSAASCRPCARSSSLRPRPA